MCCHRQIDDDKSLYVPKICTKHGDDVIVSSHAKDHSPPLALDQKGGGGGKKWLSFNPRFQVFI